MKPLPIYEVVTGLKKFRADLKVFGRDVWRELRPRRMPRPDPVLPPPQTTSASPPLTVATPEGTGLSMLEPGPALTVAEVQAGKERLRQKELREAQRKKAKQPAPMVEKAHECEGLYGDLELLMPTYDVVPQILECHLLEPCHPNWTKRMIALKVRRGGNGNGNGNGNGRTYRVLLFLAEAHCPIVYDQDVFDSDIGSFFKESEKRAIMKGYPLKLEKWKGDPDE